MRMWTRASALAPALGRTCVLLATVALASACSSSNQPSPATTGNAIMDWTVDGTKNPSLCAATGAATFHVILFNSGGGFAGAFVQDCTAFATTIFGLFDDTYTGQANLLDASGAARTTTINIAPFGVFGGTTTTVGLDFPANSFF